MNLEDISTSNLHHIALIENAAELFKLNKYRSRQFTESYIGLTTARVGFYSQILGDSNKPLPLPTTKTTFNDDLDIKIFIEGIVALKNVPINNGAGGIIYSGYGLLEVNGVVIYDGRGASDGTATWGLISGSITDQTDLISYLTSNYYTQTQVDTLLANKANVTHTHTLADITDSGALAALDTVSSTEIDNLAVTNSKLSTMGADTIKGRLSTLGEPQDLTGTQVTTLLDPFTSTLQGVVPSSGGGTTNFLRADGTWAAPTTPTTYENALTEAAGVVKFGGALTGSTSVSIGAGLDLNFSIPSSGNVLRVVEGIGVIIGGSATKDNILGVVHGSQAESQGEGVSIGRLTYSNGSTTYGNQSSSEGLGAIAIGTLVNSGTKGDAINTSYSHVIGYRVDNTSIYQQSYGSFIQNDTANQAIIGRGISAGSRLTSNIQNSVNFGWGVTTPSIRFSQAANSYISADRLTIGGTTRELSAALQVDSTDKGVLFPRLSTGSRGAMPSLVAGIGIYNTTTNKPEWYNGSSWDTLGTANTASGEAGLNVGAALSANTNYTESVTVTGAVVGDRVDCGLNDDFYDDALAAGANITCYAKVTAADTVQVWVRTTVFLSANASRALWAKITK